MKSLTVICCSVLRREIEEILSRDYPEAEMIFLSSMLHMHPEMLRKAIDGVLLTRPDRPCLLVYGDCHAHIQETAELPLCTKTDAINCGDLLLGRDLYQTFRREKAFLFLPEWTKRWREVFQKELGFSDQSLAREFMQENQSRLIYIDSGLIPVPEKTLFEISEYFSMPMDIVSVSLDQLRETVLSAVKNLEARSRS
jgi:hypothetical protein